MFKNWFKKQEKTKTEELNHKEFACIKYFVNQDGLRVDVAIEDFDKKSIASLAYVLNSMNGSEILGETVEIISLFFKQEGRQKELLELYSMINEEVTDFLTSTPTKNKENSPCIKPSDML